MKSSKVKKMFYVALGFICLALGAAGVVLPLLPTTPLILLAAFCFASGNKKLEAWLLRSRLFGPFIENYRTGQGISKRRKAVTIAYLWVGLVASMLIIRTTAIYLILGMVGIGVTIHLLMLKTKM